LLINRAYKRLKAEQQKKNLNTTSAPAASFHQKRQMKSLSILMEPGVYEIAKRKADIG